MTGFEAVVCFANCILEVLGLSRKCSFRLPFKYKLDVEVIKIYMFLSRFIVMEGKVRGTRERFTEGSEGRIMFTVVCKDSATRSYN